MTRRRCPGCLRPLSFCYCERLPRIRNRTPVVVVQHARESAHPYGTLRIATLGLERLSVVIGSPEAEPPPLPDRAALLFPGDDVPELATLPAADRPDALVLVDGTWGQARKLVRRNRWLAALPRVRLIPAAPSTYRIRREPKHEYVSTIESLVAALEILEPGTPDLRRLLAAFDDMVDGVVDHVRTHGKTPRFRRSSTDRREQLLPLAAAADRLVIVAGEGTYQTEPGGAESVRRLIAWGAVRPSDGTRFFRLVRPPRPLSLERLRRMELEANALRMAEEVDDVRAAWRAWRRDDDVLVAWAPAAAGFLRCLEDPSRLLSMKGIVNRWRRGCRGPLEAQLDALGIEPPDPLEPGRPGQTLANTAALADHLVREAAGPRD